MRFHYTAICGSLVAAAAIMNATTAASALTMKECSAKYKAAQTAGTLKGMKWSDFRKAECGSDSTTATPAAAPAPTTTTTAPAVPRTSPRPAAAPKMAPATSDAVFPSAVSPQYSSESAGKARMHTCLDQYKANKATGGNGGLNWIQKGGGYYSECNKRLKS